LLQQNISLIYCNLERFTGHHVKVTLQRVTQRLSKVFLTFNVEHQIIFVDCITPLIWNDF